MDKSLTHCGLMWDVLTHPCPNFYGSLIEVRVWISNYISLFYMDAITYPCPNPGVVNSDILKAGNHTEKHKMIQPHISHITIWTNCSHHFMCNQASRHTTWHDSMHENIVFMVTTCWPAGTWNCLRVMTMFLSYVYMQGWWVFVASSQQAPFILD